MSGDDALEVKDLRDVQAVVARVVAALEKNDVEDAAMEVHQLAGLAASDIMTDTKFDVHQVPHQIGEFLTKTPPDIASALALAREFHRAVNGERKTVEGEVLDK